MTQERYEDAGNFDTADAFERAAAEDLALEFASYEEARRVRWRLLVWKRRNESSVVVRWPDQGKHLLLTTKVREAERKAEQQARCSQARYDQIWPRRRKAMTRPMQPELPLGSDESPRTGSAPPSMDFLMFVGSRYYPTIRSFTDEAREVGVSKRIGKVPVGLTVGQSRVFLAHEGAKGRIPCPACTKRNRSKCVRCGGKGVAREHVIFGYFIPAHVDLIVRDEEAEALAAVITQSDTRIVSAGDAVREADRGCGRREPGGLYLASDPDTARKRASAANLESRGMVVFRKARPYPGRHFLGIKEFLPKDYGIRLGHHPPSTARRNNAPGRTRVTLERRGRGSPPPAPRRQPHIRRR